jgi:hypothetical protein
MLMGWDSEKKRAGVQSNIKWSLASRAKSGVVFITTHQVLWDRLSSMSGFSRPNERKVDVVRA